MHARIAEVFMLIYHCVNGSPPTISLLSTDDIQGIQGLSCAHRRNLRVVPVPPLFRLRGTVPPLLGGLKMREWKMQGGNCGTVTQGVENEGIQNACLVLSKLNIMNNSH